MSKIPNIYLEMILIPVKGIPLIQPGMDLAQIIASRAKLRSGDILVISSTALSKSLGNLVNLDEIQPSREAMRIAGINNEDPRFIELVLRESKEILIETPFILSVTKWGHVCANAGIDRSNAPAGFAIIPPSDPDRSARELRARIQKITGKKIAVIISDTCGRAFRLGQTGIGWGCAGIQPIKDWRGDRDLYGNILRVKQQAIVDELAAAANLVMGESCQGIPAVIVRGFKYRSSRLGIRSLIRPDHQDLVKQALRILRDRCTDTSS